MRAHSLHTASTAKSFDACASNEHSFFTFTKQFHKHIKKAAQSYFYPFSYLAINCFSHGIANVVFMEYHLPAPSLPQQGLNHVPGSRKRSTKRKTVPLTLWIKPEMKAELKHLAAKDDISLSKLGGTLLTEAVHQQLHIIHTTLMQPIIESAIRKQMGLIITRLTWLLVRIAYDTGQTRTLVTNILDQLLGSDQTKVSHILAGSSETAKRNITRQTPQIKTLIAEVEKWMREEGNAHD